MPSSGRDTSRILTLALQGSIVKGGHVFHDVEGEDLKIIFTGSEVQIAVAATGILEKECITTRVISLPRWRVFDAQSTKYQLEVLRSGAPYLSLEAYTTVGWQKYSHGISGFLRANLPPR